MATLTNIAAKTMQSPQEQMKFPTSHYKPDPSHQMLAAEFHGSKDIKLVTRPKPMITDPGDVVLRMTTNTICGSDLHLYHHEMMGISKGDIFGHEGVGIVEQVGPDCKTLKVGDRVAISFDIACGNCENCKKQKFTLCLNTNPTPLMDTMYGHRISAAFGYTHLLGGYEGAQAQFLRVPIADVNTIKIPDSMSDDIAILLSDIACTGWHGNELGEVKAGDVVAIWGCGPVGLMAAMWAKFRGSKQVICIDNVPYRLNVAKNVLKCEVINFDERNVLDAIKELVPLGPDVCIDCVGFRYAKSLLHKAERAIKVETDTPEILSECIKACRTGGHVSIIGDYFAMANQFPIGAMMEKSLTVRGGQSYVQKYWHKLMEYFVTGAVDPSFVITHKLPFDQIVEAYRVFDNKEDGALKILLKPTLTAEERR